MGRTCATSARDSNQSLGRFRLGQSSQSAHLDGTCFPCDVFCIAPQMLTICMSTRKRPWQRMPLLHSPWAKSLSLRGYPGGRSRGQWSGLSPDNASLVWHCTCCRSNRGSVWDPARVPFPRFPLRPRKPDSARSHTACDSDIWFEKAGRHMPYLGIGSISGIIHIMARLPHAARAVVVVAVLIAIWR